MHVSLTWTYSGRTRLVSNFEFQNPPVQVKAQLLKNIAFVHFQILFLISGPFCSSDNAQRTTHRQTSAGDLLYADYAFYIPFDIFFFFILSTCFKQDASNTGSLGCGPRATIPVKC
ncbi:hypothetical protein T07_12694 [Trichinella nelsoni]|uniref:Uncharacterized protein n=1 Tax=Trichinella nelsoni TaxID=6336 RepID=A0A0V0RV68_9BILA|nr:hypothetical protein T07_12694 [Trichinella nelsoni]